jgi:type VI secretion system protein ImpK
LANIDDPFAEPANPEGTVILPNPGGRSRDKESPAAAPAAQPQPLVGASNKPIDFSALSKLNPLVSAALPLLDLSGQIKNRASHGDPESLRDRVIAEINEFERRITQLGVSPRTIRSARYALCATIDDVVLNTPWGSQSIWSQQSMAATFHNEVVGGNRFWELLDQLKKEAAVNVDLLELLYVCISLGFEGKYRTLPRGASELILVREDLYRLIRNNRGNFERSLSPRWRGAQAAHKGLRDILPIWLVGVLSLGILGLLYAILTFILNARSDAAYEALNGLPPLKPVVIGRAVAAPPPPPPVEGSQLKKIREFLRPEIERGAVAVLEDAQTITVRITNQAMFDSGSATVAPAVLPLLQRIGVAANCEPGPLLLVGHTDNQPIRSVKFPSNYHLSLARAEAVRAVIANSLKEPRRLSTEGHADSQPLADNTTPQGREQNRRIELILLRTDQDQGACQ